MRIRRRAEFYKIIQSACKSAFILHETWYTPVRMNGEWINVFDWTRMNGMNEASQ